MITMLRWKEEEVRELRKVSVYIDLISTIITSRLTFTTRHDYDLQWAATIASTKQ